MAKNKEFEAEMKATMKELMDFCNSRVNAVEKNLKAYIDKKVDDGIKSLTASIDKKADEATLTSYVDKKVGDENKEMKETARQLMGFSSKTINDNIARLQKANNLK